MVSSKLLRSRRSSDNRKKRKQEKAENVKRRPSCNACVAEAATPQVRLQEACQQALEIQVLTEDRNVNETPSHCEVRSEGTGQQALEIRVHTEDRNGNETRSCSKTAASCYHKHPPFLSQVEGSRDETFTSNRGEQTRNGADRNWPGVFCSMLLSTVRCMNSCGETTRKLHGEQTKQE